MTNNRQTINKNVLVYITEMGVNPCLNQPCQNNGTCFSRRRDRQYMCDCTDGFTGPACQYSK